MSRFQIETAGFAQEDEDKLSAGDRAEVERFRTMIDARRQKVAAWYMLQMRALIERPDPGSEPARDRSRAGAAPQ